MPQVLINGETYHAEQRVTAAMEAAVLSPRAARRNTATCYVVEYDGRTRRIHALPRWRGSDLVTHAIRWRRQWYAVEFI